MEYVLMTEPQAGGTYQDLLGLARWAHEQGLVSIARSDHYLNQKESAHATDALSTLAGLARDTEELNLTVLMTPITFRHPAIIAKTAATIDEMSGGRLELGIGTGWMEPEHESFGVELPDMRERFTRLYETLAYVSAAFGRGNSGYRGRHYELAEIDVLPRPTGRLPIIVGGGGLKKTPMMAGRFADEFNSFACPPQTLEPRLEVLRTAAVEVGRDPDEILISMMVPVFVGVDEADYKDVIGEAAAARETNPADLEERLSNRGIPFGTADRLAVWAEDAAGHGLGRIYLQEFSHLADINTDRLGEVLTVVRGG